MSGTDPHLASGDPPQTQSQKQSSGPTGPPAELPAVGRMMAPKVAHALKRRNENITSCGKKYFANLMKLRNVSRRIILGHPRGPNLLTWVLVRRRH